ncbi:hypothetical protein VM1G_11709 [Cytospora mali]|uniref:Uncharacterized protein n=1 Tax=Cytospora mali TaxID=578113 RepID=A0A194W2T8_CYTMA|nr:hypothetical protein VM1G_11709 [Valsa mali]
MRAEKAMPALLPRTQALWSDSWPGFDQSENVAVFHMSYPVMNSYMLPEPPLPIADVPSLAGIIGNEASEMPNIGSLAGCNLYVKEAFGRTCRRGPPSLPQPLTLMYV